jgi:hypothetical protein
MTELFPFRDYWWSYAAFGGLIALLLALDLWVHRSLSTRTAAAWSAVWILLGLSFSLVIYLLAMPGPAGTWLEPRNGLRRAEYIAL